MRRDRKELIAVDPVVDRVLNKAKTDEAILAVILFGSLARGEQTSTSDVDLCLVLHPSHAIKSEQLSVREDYLPFLSRRLDIRVFQQLPLYIRKRVLKEGRVVFCRDEDALYEVGYRTARAFEEFKPYYRRYLEEVARAGS